jgi:hypothetical protein
MCTSLFTVTGKPPYRQAATTATSATPSAAARLALRTPAVGALEGTDVDTRVPAGDEPVAERSGLSAADEEIMARQQRNVEGNNEQRRDAAREARAQGKLPSEMGGTLGASKQRKSAPNDASHQEKMDLKQDGKASRGNRTSGAQKPRPGNRDVDPKRDDDRYE